MTIILKLYHSTNESLIKRFIHLLQNFFNQSTNYFEKIRFSKRLYRIEINLFIIYILLYIWIINTSILSKAFTSILLNTYFNSKPSLTVETLDDIINNPNLYIGGKNGAKHILERNSSVYRNIWERVIDYEKKMNVNSDNQNQQNLLNNRIVKDIYDRKAILMLTTFWTNMFKSLYRGFNLMESQNKYDLRFGYSYISKNHPNSEQIYKM